MNVKNTKEHMSKKLYWDKQEIKLISFLNFNMISFFAFLAGELQFIVETCCPCIVAFNWMVLPLVVLFVYVLCIKPANVLSIASPRWIVRNRNYSQFFELKTYYFTNMCELKVVCWLFCAKIEIFLLYIKFIIVVLNVLNVFYVVLIVPHFVDFKSGFELTIFFKAYCIFCCYWIMFMCLLFLRM